jgi:hypothetical protein
VLRLIALVNLAVSFAMFGAVRTVMICRLQPHAHREWAPFIQWDNASQ